MSKTLCSICGKQGTARCREPVCEYRYWTIPEEKKMAFEDAIMVKNPIPEWLVEVTMTVRKYINAGSKEEAMELALEDDDYVRMMEKQIAHVELITK